MVNEKGIEIGLDKVRVILEMPTPMIEKEVHGFLGKLNYIARFTSQLIATYNPIFKLLNKNQKNEWNRECQEAFEKIKQYLQKPSFLIPLVLGRPLIMYLTMLDESIGCVLGQHEEFGKKEHVIYYLSKKFTNWEMRYSSLERTRCALAWVARQLRQYMLSHTTWLVSKLDPIKYIFEKPEYNITYVTKKDIKGSVLV
ncbi:Retrovirus-related Pol polyprotein from transposon 17.6, partial [Mucuna pruriens]